MHDRWIAVTSTAAVPPGAVVPVDVGTAELVVWRTRAGTLGVLPRRCPHLDWDLAQARVVGEELVCAAHEWCFDVRGRAGKRNFQGRFDTKGEVAAPAVREHGDQIEIDTADVEELDR